MSTMWQGMLAPLDVSTGDGRRFLSSGVTSRPLPLPLRWQRSDSSGHDDSVVVGALEELNHGTVAEAITNGWIPSSSVETLDRDLIAVWGMGRLFDSDPRETPRLSEDIAEVIILLGGQKNPGEQPMGVIGPSVDAGSYEACLVVKGQDHELTDEELEALFWSDTTPEFEVLFTEYQIAAATLVPIPAFEECRPFVLFEPALTAAVNADGWSDKPLAERDTPWDSAEAEKRLADNANIGTDDPNWEVYGEAFMYQDDDSNASTKGAYKFPICDILDGVQRIIPRAVFAVAATLQGARGGTKIPQQDQNRMKSVVEKLYERMGETFNDDTIVVPWASEASIISTVTAAAATIIDPKLFDDPQLEHLTPITIEDGRVFGHIATHDVCHVGMPVCVTAPESPTAYAMFHRYQPDGLPLPVGRITVGHGQRRCACQACQSKNDDHACIKESLPGAIAHHDTMSTVAWIRIGEDPKLNAVWAAGVIADGATEEDINVLSRQKVSGDWRPHAGSPELIEVLALSSEEPGFPLPRLKTGPGGLSAITAAGVVRAAKPEPSEPTDEYAELAERIATRVTELVSSLVTPVPVSVTPEPTPEPEPDSRIDSLVSEITAIDLHAQIGGN